MRDKELEVFFEGCIDNDREVEIEIEYLAFHCCLFGLIEYFFDAGEHLHLKMKNGKALSIDSHGMRFRIQNDTLIIICSDGGKIRIK